eukprot:3486265-Rhodomonas_salina.1
MSSLITCAPRPLPQYRTSRSTVCFVSTGHRAAPYATTVLGFAQHCMLRLYRTLRSIVCHVSTGHLGRVARAKALTIKPSHSMKK